MEEKKLKKVHIFSVQAVCVFIITYVFHGVDMESIQKWVPILSRYILYFLIFQLSHEACVLLDDVYQNGRKLDLSKFAEAHKKQLMVMVSFGAILFHWKEAIINEHFLLIFIAFTVYKLLEKDENATVINYGVGMACSFYEGYLTHIIPSDGAYFVGFEENINIYEAKQGVIFPVKRLFLVITKSLYCPPDLKQFNKKESELNFLEACQVSEDQSLEDVKKDVAGVKNRTYRNSAYKVHRKDKPYVYLAAECATPLHTLHKVLEKRALYDRLADADGQQIMRDFCATLQSIVAKSPEARDKCELVYFDDTDPKQNLADVLLDKIRELEPNFETIISTPR